jgi:hypothetical protein
MLAGMKIALCKARIADTEDLPLCLLQFNKIFWAVESRKDFGGNAAR